MVSYDYISYSDLRRKWQPKDVVQRVIEDANEYAASTISLSISQSPVVKGSEVIPPFLAAVRSRAG